MRFSVPISARRLKLAHEELLGCFEERRLVVGEFWWGRQGKWADALAFERKEEGRHTVEIGDCEWPGSCAHVRGGQDCSRIAND